MGLENILVILALVPIYGFAIGLHFDLIDEADMFRIQELVQNIDLQPQSDSLVSNAFMSSSVEGLIEHAYVDLGLKKMLVDPNEIPNSGDEYFDNLINECSFHSDDSIEGNACVVCKLLDTEIDGKVPPQCVDFWIDFEGVGQGDDGDNASHQQVLDYLKDNFGITLTVDFRNDNNPNDDQVTTYNSNRMGDFNDGDCDFDIQHEFQPGDDPSIGNLLIMREDGSGSNCQPNDRGAGGTLMFVLDKPMFLESIDVIDHDNQPTGGPEDPDSRIMAWDDEDCLGTPIADVDIEKFDFEKSLQKVVINAEDVLCFKIIYPDSGGFTNIHLRCIPCIGAWIDLDELDHDADHQDVLDYFKNNFGITLSVDFFGDANPNNDELTIYDTNIFGPDPLPPNPGPPLNDCDFDLEHELVPDDPNVKKLLIMREDGSGSNCQPNDRGAGGTLMFVLDNPIFLESIDVIDHDNQPNNRPDSRIMAWDNASCTGTPIADVDIEVFNIERTVQRIFLNANNVLCFKIIYPDSGGFTNFHFTCPENGGGVVELMKKEINPEDVIAEGIEELVNGYTGSDKVTIKLDEPAADVMETMAVAIRVFRNEVADPSGLFVGDVIIADDERDAIIKVDLATGDQTIISNDQNNRWDDPENLLIDNQGRLLVADGDKPGSNGPGTIFEVDPADGSVSVFTSGGMFDDGPEDLVEDDSGNIYVADDGTDMVIKVTPGGVQSFVAQLNFDDGKLEGITLDNSGDIIVVGGTGSSAKVIKIVPNTGDKTEITKGDKLLRPEGVAVAFNGDIIIADGNPSDSNNPSVNGQILRVDPVSGDQSFLSTGDPWVDPSDVEILSERFALVTDDAAEGMGALIQVDLLNGDTEIISANGFFDSPEGLFIVKTVPPASSCLEPPPPPPPTEECPDCKKPHFLTVRYNNDLHPNEKVTVEVFKDTDDFPGTPLITKTGIMDGSLIEIDGSSFTPPNSNGKVNSNTAYCILFDRILGTDTFSPYSGGDPRVSHTCVEFHTSCSERPREFFVGTQYSPESPFEDLGVTITVVSGTDASGISTIPDLSCKE